MTQHSAGPVEADISPNHTTGSGVLFLSWCSFTENAKFLPISTNVGYFIANLRTFMYFLQA